MARTLTLSKDPYTSSSPAHAITKGQVFLHPSDPTLPITVRNHPTWIEEQGRYKACIIGDIWFGFNEPVRVIVGAASRGVMS